MTVHRGTVDARQRVYSTDSLSWEAQSTATGGAAGSTVQTVSTVQGQVITKPASTSWVTQAGLSINSSNELLTVGAAAGATVVTVSTGSLRVHQSSAAELQMTAGQASTVWAVQVDGRVRAQNSTIGDFLASVQQNSTTWLTQAIIRDSSGVAYPGIITRPTTAVMALPVRTVLNNLQSTGFSTIGNNSTSSTVVSSVAGERVKVYAYSITSTHNGAAANTLTFNSSAADMLWPIVLRAFSSAISGVNLAVSPPGWLFATDAGSPLVFKVSGATGTYHLALSYFVEA